MAGIITPIGFLYFPALFKARGNKQVPTQPPRFSAMLLIDEGGEKSTAYQNLRQGVMAAMVDKFGAAKAQDPNFIKTLRLPFRAASEKSYEGFADGKIFMSAWSPADQKPGVVDLQANPILTEADVFGGQLCRFTVRPFAYDTSGNKGVGMILEHVQIVRADMARRDGGVSAQDAFKGADDDQLKLLGIDPNSSMAGTQGAAAAAGQTTYQTSASNPLDNLPF